MFIWSAEHRCEQRNASGSVTAQFFTYGETISGTSYFYCRDQLGSIREMTNSFGSIQAEYAFEPYGRVTKISETLPSDFGYGGYYSHGRSGLYAALSRIYSPTLARWLSRDPQEEGTGLNLYDYVNNSPNSFVDPSGQDAVGCVVGGAVGGVVGGLIGKNPAAIEEGAAIGSEIGSGLGDVAKAAAAVGIVYMGQRGRGNQSNEFNKAAKDACQGLSGADFNGCVCAYLNWLLDNTPNCDTPRKKKLCTALKAANCKRHRTDDCCR